MALAQQFGVTLGSGSSERTPQFYADLITSREILWQTVIGRYPVRELRGERGEFDLVAYYKVREKTEEMRIERAIEELTEDLSVATDRDTGIVSFSYMTSDPLLSHGVVTHLLDLVNDFDLTTRQSQAGAERVFTGERLAQVTSELRQVEDSLQHFLVENRVFSNSPTLQFQHDRFQRSVAMRQQLVTSLAQAFEQARIEEVRNTPVITLIEPPRIPALRDKKSRILILLTGMMAGVAFGALAAIFFRNAPGTTGGTRPPDLQELASLWSDTKTDIRRVFRRRSRRSIG